MVFDLTTHPIYIDSDEEILEVVERLRDAVADNVPLVVPARSRVAQSRFSLQLLREYSDRLGKHVAIVSPDARLQAMARDNGFAAYSSLEDLAPGNGFVAAAPIPAEFAHTDFAPQPDVDALGEVRRHRPPAPPERWPVDDRQGAFAVATAPPPRRFEPPAPVYEAMPWERTPARAATLAAAVEFLRARPKLLYGGAAALLMLGILLMALYVPSAQVTVFASARQFSQQADLVITPGDPNVHVRTATVDKSAQQSFPATGTKTTPATPATGSVNYNNQCPFGLSIKDGQKLDGAGQQFAQQGTVSVDHGSTASANVTAVKPGVAGNVGAGQITTIELPDNAQDVASCLTVTNPNPLTGGADEKKQNQVSQADLDKAKDQLTQQLKGQVHDELAKQANPGETLSDKTFFQPGDFKADHKVGDTVDNFSASLTGHAVGAFYVTDEVKKAFSQNLARHVPAGFSLTDTPLQTDYQVTASRQDGQLKFHGRASGYIAPHLDYDNMRSNLAGHSPEAAKRYLGTLPVQSTQIEEHPFQLPVLPFLGSRIDIRYVVQQAPSGA